MPRLSSTTTGTTARSSRHATGGILLGLFVYGVVELVAFGYCSFQQLITTHDSIVGILQGGVLVPSHMTVQQFMAYLQSNMDKFNKIAWFIATITQVIFWGAALPSGPIHNRFLHNLIVFSFFILEVATDLWYSVATSTTLGGAIVWIFNFGNGGWFVSLCYIGAMSAGSIFLGIRGLNHLGQALAPVFRSSP